MEINPAKTQRTFCMTKPDAWERGLIGKLIHRFERRGLKLVGVKFGVATPEMMREHYKDVASEDWFEDLIAFVTSGPLLAMVWEGPNAIEAVDQIVGDANPMLSDPGTIRCDYALQVPQTTIHRARDEAEAKMQIALWFGNRANFVSEDLLPPAGEINQMAEDIIPQNPTFKTENMGTQPVLPTGFDYKIQPQPEHLGEPFTPNSAPPIMPSRQIHPIYPSKIQEY